MNEKKNVISKIFGILFSLVLFQVFTAYIN